MIPLVISISYGNIPFYNNSSIESSDIVVTTDKNIDKSELSFIENSTYTWAEVKRYVIRNEMTFTRVFRNTVVISGVAVAAVMIDRLFLRR